MRTLPNQQGVTLFEMMITLAILAILLTVVAPSVQNILIQNRIVAEINELSGIVQYARAKAIEEQANTVVCPSADFVHCGLDWNQARIVFIDENNDGIINAGNEELLVATSPTASANILTGPAIRITFRDSGILATPATLKLCHKSLDVKYARALTISLQGRIKMSRDTNDDGVYEKNDGSALTCT